VPYQELLSMSAIRDEARLITHLVGAANDITAFKQYEQQLDYLAHHDTVTGLPNRVTLEKHFIKQSARAIRDGYSVAAIFIDLDHFKSINDSFGHACGDMMLKAIGARLNQCLREGDLVGRLGGDEFIVLASGLRTLDDGLRVANRLKESLKKPLLFDHREIFCSVSVGLAICPQDSISFDELLNFADSAMYKAKQLGRNAIECYSPELSVSSNRYYDIFSALRPALERDEFLLHYQPTFNMTTGEVRSLEALIRWNRPGHGLVPQGDFIPVAEQSGLINKIGDWVLETACGQAAEWCRLGLSFGRVAVNLSARQLHEPDMAARILGVLARVGLPPNKLELELTESALMDNPEHASTMMRQLRDQGVSMAIDDFGTGYSSLMYLNTLPLDMLKIDQCFVARLPDGDTIATTIIKLAEGLGLGVTGEGVETEVQKDKLLNLGCALGQGYLLCRPGPAGDIQKRLELQAIS